MKKLIFSVAALSVALAITSCSDDDDNSFIPDEEVVEVPDGGEVEPDVDPIGNAISQVVINEFSASGGWVEFHNQTDAAVDVSGYWLCLAPTTYRNVGAATILSGTTEIPANGFLVVEYDFDSFSAVTSGGLGLYLNNDGFGDSDNILDFVQYGDAGSARENVAVEAGIWELGDFVPSLSVDSSSFAYDGDGNSSDDWSEVENPTVGLDNNTEIEDAILAVVPYDSPQNLSLVRSNPDRLSLDSPEEFFDIEFQASAGNVMNFVSMSSISNDWLFAPEGQGIQVFDESGAAITGDVTNQIRLWDAGTEEENEATRGSGDGIAEGTPREDDDDNTVRIQESNVSEYLTAEISYDEVTEVFTLRITNLRGESADSDPIRISPGILVVQAEGDEDPFFTEGEPERGNGLQLLAERGNFSELEAFFAL